MGLFPLPPSSMNWLMSLIGTQLYDLNYFRFQEDNIMSLQYLAKLNKQLYHCSFIRDKRLDMMMEIQTRQRTLDLYRRMKGLLSWLAVCRTN